MNLRDTFLLRSFARDTHLWVVAHEDANGIVIFNFTSHKVGCDESCVIEVGEHPFVTRKSVVAYQFGKHLDPPTTRILEENGIYKKLDQLDLALLKKILAGAITSRLTADKLKDLIRLSL